MTSLEVEPGRVAIRRLALTTFRSYRDLVLPVEAPLVAVTGANGSGKTNLLEAISLFAQGRGLRRADPSALAYRPGDGSFAVSLDVETPQGPVQCGTGLQLGADGPVRRFRLDREPVGSAKAFADHIRLVWLTPAMDQLFAGSPGERRRFLDRLVLAVDFEHGTRVAALERALRQRNRLLEDGRADVAWLDAVEREAAELAVAVAAARQETVSRLAALLSDRQESAFPWAAVSLVGDVESLCATEPALVVEDRFRIMLKDGRARDAAAGRALVGPQAADLAVRHGPKDLDAALCSTGEQKALLIGLILAHARLVADLSGVAPMLLLDEVCAHLDEARRNALFVELSAIPGQVWMTGAEADQFRSLEACHQLVRVSPGVAL